MDFYILLAQLLARPLRDSARRLGRCRMFAGWDAQGIASVAGKGAPYRRRHQEDTKPPGQRDDSAIRCLRLRKA